MFVSLHLKYPSLPRTDAVSFNMLILYLNHSTILPG